MNLSKMNIIKYLIILFIFFPLFTKGQNDTIINKKDERKIKYELGISYGIHQFSKVNYNKTESLFNGKVQSISKPPSSVYLISGLFKKDFFSHWNCLAAIQLGYREQNLNFKQIAPNYTSNTKVRAIIKNVNLLIGPEYVSKYGNSEFLVSVLGGLSNFISTRENIKYMDIEVTEGRDLFRSPLLQISIGLNKKMSTTNLGFHIFFQQSWYGGNNLIGTNPHHAKFDGISRIIGIRLNTILNY